jgi:serine/arginine repetitive matrix protein 2
LGAVQWRYGGGWEELEENGTAKDKAKKKNDGTVGKKEGKEKKTKNKKTEDAESRGDDAKKSKSKKSSKSKSSKLKDSVQAPEASTPRLSTSSFEVGALSASPGPMAARTLGESTSSYSSVGAGSGAYLGVGGVAQKKRSILGLGLPSTIRLPTVRSGSTASSVLVGGANTVGPSFGAAPTSAAAAAAAFSVSGNNNNNATNDNRLSVDSALNNPATTPRPSSALSNASSAGSSLRPISTTSTDSRLSRASSVGSSVRWDEEGLETIRERRGKERAAGAAADDKEKEKEKADRRTSKESKRSAEGRKRGSLASLFPDSRRGSYASSEGGREERGSGRMGGYPIVTIEEATVDGHGSVDDDDDRMLVDEESGHRGFGDSEDRMDVDDDGDQAPAPTETPVKQQKVRTRPVSEQLLKGSRPKAVYEDDEGSFAALFVIFLIFFYSFSLFFFKFFISRSLARASSLTKPLPIIGVISILDAATNDLAMLINILDLQATPGNTPNATPLKASPSVAGSSVMSSAVSSVVSSTAMSTMSAGEGATPAASTKTTMATRGGIQQRRVADSPLKKTLRPSGSSSISSLRPYAQSRGYSGSNSNRQQQRSSQGDSEDQRHKPNEREHRHCQQRNGSQQRRSFAYRQADRTVVDVDAGVIACQGEVATVVVVYYPRPTVCFSKRYHDETGG